MPLFVAFGVDFGVRLLSESLRLRLSFGDGSVVLGGGFFRLFAREMRRVQVLGDLAGARLKDAFDARQRNL